MEINLKESTVKALKDLERIYPGTESLEYLANYVIQREWGLQYYTIKDQGRGGRLNNED